MTDNRCSYSWADVRSATKSANSLERVFTFPSEPLSYLLLNCTRLTPNAVTLLGIAFGLCGAWFYLREEWAAAFIAYALFFLLDCCDGTMARASGQTSINGAKLDLYGDRIVLFVTVLCRMSAYLEQGQSFPALLCMLYLVSHYSSDLRWLMRLHAQAELPPQWTELKGELQRQLRARSATAGLKSTWWKQGLHGVAKAEREIAPTAWVCNIAFIVGACLVPHTPVPLYIAATLALQWSSAVYWARRFVKTGLGAAS